MKRNISNLVLVVLLILNLIFLGILIIRNKNKSQESATPVREIKKEERVIAEVGEENPTTLIATIKKEVIPPELELGDYWYWAYFGEPYLQVNNAAGVPMYIDKIQLNPPTNQDFYNLDNFTDKKVEIYGYQTWGYAESSVFQVLAIREL